MDRVFITGIAGQDGSYLAEHHLARGDEVFGMLRRHSVAETQDVRISHLGGKVTTFYGDMTDATSLYGIITDIKPSRIYNLAAQSHVRISFDMPMFTAQTNALGVLNILEIIRKHLPRTRYYQASSSEMFGNSVDSDGVQRLLTPMNPTSPYGIAKLYAYHMVRHYRRAYGLFATNGILFNHESHRRGSNFVIAKIVRGLVDISCGRQDKLVLGNLDASRDWSHAKDMTRAMIQILDHDTPDDWIVASGESHTVRSVVDYVLQQLGLGWDVVDTNPMYERPEELRYLRGDASKFATAFPAWKREYSFKMIIDEMIKHYQ